MNRKFLRFYLPSSVLTTWRSTDIGTPIGTMEREVGAVTYRDGVLLIATKECAEAHSRDASAEV